MNKFWYTRIHFSFLQEFESLNIYNFLSPGVGGWGGVGGGGGGWGGGGGQLLL